MKNTRLKRLNFTPKMARNSRITSRYYKVNLKHSQSINIDKLFANNKIAIMDTDEYGNLIAEPSNSLHRRWLED